MDRPGNRATVVGFTWDSRERSEREDVDGASDNERNLRDAVQNYLPAAFAIAERNGPKLAAFLADYAAATGATIRLLGQSLGARIAVEAVAALDEWGRRDVVDSLTFLGIAYRLWAMNGVLGADGIDGTPPANYADHEVPTVPDHRSYSEPGEGCMDRVVEQF